MTAKRSDADKTSGTPPIPKLTVPRAQAEEQIASRIEKGQQLLGQRISTKDELGAARTVYYTWGEYNRDLLRRIFDSPEIAEEYARWSGFAVLPDTFQEEVQDHFQNIKDKVRRLASIKERLPLYSEPTSATESTTEAKPIPKTRTVFIVHGTDEASKEKVARFLEKLKLDYIILHEQPNKGRTIIEKFEDYSSVAFAVVLLTPDDIGSEMTDGVADGAKMQMRARQNVVFELGYFIGKLGREMVCALHSEEIELPSDFTGVLYVPLDKGGGWQMKLAQELKAAGIDVDLNKAI